MGLKETTIKYAAESMAETFDNLNNIGVILQNIVSTKGSADVAVDASGNINIVDVFSSSISALENTLTEPLQAVGYAISALFFLISLIELANSDRFSLEQFIKFFTKFVISFLLIMNCTELTGDIRDFGTGLADLIATKSADSFDRTAFQQKAQTVMEQDKDMSWFDPLLLTVFTFVPLKFVSMALMIVTYVVGITRMFEIIIRSIMMPIALGLISDDGWRGAGGRYIKKYIALCAQGAVLVLIGNITATIMGKLGDALIANFSLGNVGMFALISVAAGVACTSIMFKSIGITNDVFGA